MRPLFWDTSAIVPLLVEETRSALAGEIWKRTTVAFAWEWILVEVDSALTRRDADPDAWRMWHTVEPSLDIARFQDDELMRLRSMNRSLGLRSAAAGPVYFLEKLSAQLPGFHLVTFDREMADSVQTMGLYLHQACS